MVHDTLDEDDESTAKSDDFITMGTDLVKAVNWKIGFWVFMVGLFVMSDLFISAVLPNFPDSSVDDVPNTKGTMIQLIMLTLAYFVIDLAVRFDYL